MVVLLTQTCLFELASFRIVCDFPAWHRIRMLSADKLVKYSFQSLSKYFGEEVYIDEGDGLIIAKFMGFLSTEEQVVDDAFLHRGEGRATLMRRFFQALIETVR